jgi:hypothetical protein
MVTTLTFVRRHRPTVHYEFAFGNSFVVGEPEDGIYLDVRGPGRVPLPPKDLLSPEDMRGYLLQLTTEGFVYRPYAYDGCPLTVQ